MTILHDYSVPYPPHDVDECEKRERAGVSVISVIYIIYQLDFNQNYYTFASILLIKIVLCSKLHLIKSISYKCFQMRCRVQEPCGS